MQQDKQDKEQGKGEAGDGDVGDIGIPLDTLDDHDAEGTVVPGEGKPTDEEVMQKIDRAIQQGAILAGVLGQDVPRIVQEAMEIPVRWDDEMQEFITSSCSNRDDFSYRRLDRRWLGTDDDMMLVPTLMQENVAEIVVAADTSGSIDARAMGAWLSTLARICEAAQPDLVRVLWWDTDVKLEQTFDRSQIGEIATLARPQGGGGTRVSSVSEYIVQRGLSPDCLIVLTDGYVEGDINWQTTVPTLWTVTGARRFRPPAGRVVNIQ
jgi:predicted metal-dependent peptidase